MSSNAFDTFKVALGDARQLMDLHDSVAAHEQKEVLKRAALIIAVAAWETYLKDFLREKFMPLLAAAKSPTDVSSAFEQVAKNWLKIPGDRTVDDLSSWTGDGWRERIRVFFDSQIKGLNTPNSKRAGKLLKDFLNVDLDNVWKWKNYKSDSASERLDEIVAKRGTVAHEARKNSGSTHTKHLLARPKVISYIQFLEELALATDRETR